VTNNNRSEISLNTGTVKNQRESTDASSIRPRMDFRSLHAFVRRFPVSTVLLFAAEGNRPRRRRRSGLSDDIQDIVVIRKGNNKADGSSAGRSFKITPINPSFDRGEEDDDEGERSPPRADCCATDSF